ncbi:MAG TPA: divergent polysaccharide deacetylase family protein [Candidatus Acidoferrales bacterium]|nr:divergent polysaccharide deacetylase family protein [Candidatus Acidoferrales bacterium]
MPRRRKSSPPARSLPSRLLLFAALAVALFVVGEAWAYLASDHGHVLLWRRLHLGDRARIAQIVGRQLRSALLQARVPASRLHEGVEADEEGGRPRWRVDVPPDGSLLALNYALTRAAQAAGVEVLDGREHPGPDGSTLVTLEVGEPGRPLHEIVLARPSRERTPAGPPRLALVLDDLVDAPEPAHALLSRHEPFAVAVPAAGANRDALRREARAGGHEIVLQIPMEPEDYPRQNPGPGTLLVSMPAGRIESALHSALGEAGGVVAVSNLMGAFATQDETFMTAFFHELRRAGVPFLHVLPAPRAVCRSLAARLGVAYDEPDEVFEADRGPRKKAGALEREWRAIVERAAKRGHAIVLVRVSPESAAWLEAALTRGTLGDVELVPLSTLLRHSAPD